MKKEQIKNIIDDESSVDLYNYKSFDFEKNIVVSFVEKFLPIIFWLGLSLIILEGLNESIDLFSWNFLEGLFAFSKIFVPYTIVYMLIFYIVYVLKDIKDSLNNK